MLPRRKRQHMSSEPAPEAAVSPPRPSRRWLVARLVLLAALGWFYVAGASAHAERVNWFKARGDQSWFLSVAQTEYHNWHGDRPYRMLRRNIMPLYPAYLAIFYDPSMSDPDYFIVAKRWNIRLSLAMLVVLGFLFTRYLPPLPATNLILVVAFGYFVFKAGYAQPELLYYFLHFLTFLAFCHLLHERRALESLALGIVAGVLAALTHLTKAAVVPLLLIVLGAYAVEELLRLREAARHGAEGMRRRARRATAWRAVAAGVLVVSFLFPLYPYIATSKQMFGRYFYNANTTFYIWHDSWGEATAIRDAGVESRWPDTPASELPSLANYWKTHTLGQIASRFGEGFQDMVVSSYRTYWYYPFVILYLGYALALIAANRKAFVVLLRGHASVAGFMALYAVVYLLAAAFYNPISATGTTRYLICHLTPLFFVIACFSAREPFRSTAWRVGALTLTPLHADLVVSATLALSLAFVLWPRLMTTYGGF
jgi:hypothetical protein